MNLNFSYFKNIFYASLLFGIILALYSCNKENIKKPDISLGTFKNPVEAFEETTKALSLISKNINKGKKSINHLKEFEKSKNLVFKNNNK